jgi:carboxypeptidase family protein/TonB-dependent receptor-like protein
MRFRRIGVSLGMLLAATLLAQDTGSITGTVRDVTGAVIPGANVTLRNTARDSVYKTVSNSSGDYLVAGLPAGSYNLSINVKDFKGYEAKGIILRVAQKARADAVLVVGDAASAITIEGEDFTQVETQSSEVSGSVTGKQISQLVLNGRNFTQLIALMPGVSNQTGLDEGTVGLTGNVAFNINGGRSEYNNWELDGGDFMDNGSNVTLNVYPNVDAIAEVRVLTSNYGAQYGRNGSATIETATKSGTKDFHGDLFEFVRNENFNARNFFAAERPAYKKNDFGYTLGGPFVIPGIYNAKRDKTFFFWSQEWRRERVPAQVFDQPVPSDAERGGDFSDVCPGPQCPKDPTTGQPFPNNRVPVDANAQAMLVLFPHSNSGSGAESFFQAAPVTPTNWREELIRIDHNFTNNVRTYLRYIHDSWDTVTLMSGFPTVQSRWLGPGVSAVAHLNINVSPALLNELIASYTTDHILITPVGELARPSSMTMTGLFNNGFGAELPAVQFCCAGYGGGFGEYPFHPWSNSNPTYTLRDQLTKIAGSHNMYFGVYAAVAQKNEPNFPYINGILTFNDGSSVTTGNAFADFLVGRVFNYSQTNVQLKYYNRYKIVEPYFQDDWHAGAHLTLNLGVRISLFGTYREKYNRAFNFDPRFYNPANAPVIDVDGSATQQPGALIPGAGNPFDGIVQCGKNGVPVSCMKGHLFNPAPRAGFAWDPFGKGKTSIRGAYGVFFEHTNGNEGNTESLEGQPPAVLNPTQYNIVGYTGIGGRGLLFPLRINAIPSKVYWPYMQQWHFDVEHEVLKATVLTASYVGSKGTHLTLQRDLNQIPALPSSLNPYAPGQPISGGDCASNTVNGNPVTGLVAVNLAVACQTNPDPFRPFKGLGAISKLEEQANSSYNALQISVRRTLGRLDFSLAYTYSHSIDDSSDRFDGNFVDSYNLRGTRASSNFDQKHILNVSYVYDVPFFQSAGLVHRILGGWQISGITAYQTGTPFDVYNAIYPDNAGVANGVGTGSFVDVVGNPYSKPPVTAVAGIPGPLLFNPNAFAAPRGLTFGNAGRNFLRNPTRTNWDTGLFKRFAIKENTAFEFRAEAFNVFNHTQWGGVNSTATCYAGANNSAGDPSCVTGNTFLHPAGAHNPRIMQLGAKFLF